MSWEENIIVGVAIKALNELFNNFGGDQTWECGPDEAEKEKGLVLSRVNDKYPQGREQVIGMLNYCHDNRKRFRIKAAKTFPFWTWYFEII